MNAEPARRTHANHGSARPFLVILGVLLALLVAALVALVFVVDSRKDRDARIDRHHAELCRALDEALAEAELAHWRGEESGALERSARHALETIDAEGRGGRAATKAAVRVRAARALRLAGRPDVVAHDIAAWCEELDLAFEDDEPLFGSWDISLPEPDEFLSADDLRCERIRILSAAGRGSDALQLAVELVLERESCVDAWDDDLDVLEAHTLAAEVLLQCGEPEAAFGPLAHLLRPWQGAGEGPSSPDEWDWAGVIVDAQTTLARAAARAGDHPMAVSHLRAALEAERLDEPRIETPPSGPRALELALELAQGSASEAGEAVVLLERTLAGRREHACGDSALLALHTQLLARALARSGDVRGAARRYAEAEAEFTRVGDGRAIEVRRELGALPTAADPLEAASRERQRDLERSSAASSDDSHERVVELNELGRALRAQGRLNEAEPYYRAALEMQMRLESGDDRGVATLANNLGLLELNLGRSAAGCARLEEALAMRRRLADGADDEDVVQSLLNVAGCPRKTGDFRRTLELESEAVLMLRRLRPEEDLDLAIAIDNRASTLFDLGRRAEALAGHREALTILRGLELGDHPDLAQTLDQLGLELYHANEHEEAARHLEEALQMRRRLFAGGHADLVLSLRHVAWVREATYDRASAVLALEEAITMQVRLDADDRCAVLRLELELADTLRLKDDATRSLEACLRASRHAIGAAGECPDLGLDALAALREASARAVEFAPAEDWLVALAEALLLQRDAQHPDRRRVLEEASAFYRAWNTSAPSPAVAERARAWSERR